MTAMVTKERAESLLESVRAFLSSSELLRLFHSPDVGVDEVTVFLGERGDA